LESELSKPLQTNMYLFIQLGESYKSLGEKINQKSLKMELVEIPVLLRRHKKFILKH